MRIAPKGPSARMPSTGMPSAGMPLEVNVPRGWKCPRLEMPTAERGATPEIPLEIGEAQR